jgi:PAS domain S-box-containing protein
MSQRGRESDEVRLIDPKRRREMLRIGTKLGIGNGVLVALCVAIGLVSYRQTRVVRQKVEEVTKVREPANSAMHALQNNLTESAFSTLAYLSTGDSVLLESFRGNQKQIREIQTEFRVVEGKGDKDSIGEKLQHGLSRTETIAENQIRVRDQQNRTMKSLLQDLDAIDGLLTERIQASLSRDNPVAYRRLQSVLEMKVNVNAITKGLGTFLATGDPQFERQVQGAGKAFEHYYGIYRNVLLSSEEKHWSAELRRVFSRSLARADSVIMLDKQRRKDLTKFLEASRELSAMLDDRILQRTELSLSEAKTDLLRAGEQANTSIIIALFLSVAFGLGAAYVGSRSITGPLHQLSSAMHAIARGDRVHKVSLATSDELRSLSDAFNLMTGQLLRANEELREEIAERQRAEEALRMSEERFRTIFEHAPIGIGLTNNAQSLIQTNPALQEMLGYSEGELRGRNVVDLIVAEDLPVQRWYSMLATGGPIGRYQREVPCSRSDGRTAWISLNVSRMKTGGGHSDNSIVMMEDITLRRTTEQQMRMLAHTITSMNEGVVITDSNDVILSVNPAFCRSYGYGEQECLGRTVRAIGLWTEPAPPCEATSGTVQTNDRNGELVAVSKSGRKFPVLVSTSMVRDEQGSPRAMVTISRDITDQRRLKTKLEEAERERLAAVRGFALSVQRAQEEERARISRELHDDLCQRLSGMKFRVEVLEDQILAAGKGAGRRLRNFAHELDRMITDVRRISSNLRPSVLDDFGLVTALRLLCRDFEKVHSIRTQFQHGNVPSRRVDPSIEIALYRIAQEALSNVARHANASTVAVRLLHEDSYLRLIVKDDGKGFNREGIDRVRASGRGFGLISMRERSELLRGTFEIDSVEGRGTTIASRLPLGESAENEKGQNTDRG